MSVRVGINGFGRIGRNFFRAVLKSKGDVEIVGINDLGDPGTLAHLLKYDSVHGRLDAEIKTTGDGLAVNGTEIRVTAETDPAKLPWKDLGVDVVIESTGRFTARADAAKHLDAGARKVIISAPSGDADVTICLGINDGEYDAGSHHVVSNASCTTNCLAPLAKVLNDRFGIERGLVTTVHAYTSDQALQDMIMVSRSGKADLRRMRAAAESIIPSTTGAAKAIGLVLPELKGRLDGMALRVPVPDGSITDLVAVVNGEPSVEEVNQAFAEAAANPSYKGVLEYSDEPLVSADIVGNPASCIYSAKDTNANGTLIKVLGWYDNEWGYSNRLVDLAAFVAK